MKKKYRPRSWTITMPAIYAKGAVLNPKIPYEDEIVELKGGDMIIVRGSIPPRCRRFCINLKKTPTGKFKDIVLHVNPRFDTREIVYNTQTGGKWGEEERTRSIDPLQQEHPFECIILVLDDCYKIAFNSRYLADYKHRLPFSEISHINIEGDVSVDSLYVEKGTSVPIGKGQRPLAIPHPRDAIQLVAERVQEVDAKTNKKAKPGPYLIMLPEGLKEEQMIFLTAVPDCYGHSFAVDLKAGTGEDSDTSLQLETIFATNTVTCRSMTNGKWGNDVTVGSNPFKKGMHFDLVIKCTKDEFLISVNNQHCTRYPLQVKQLPSLKLMMVKGEISLVSVCMQ